ncbi:zinc finger protein 608-like [Haliotis rubra]|uniref:zinc finger protein 608-like n=1 Tax=Haliotis rubra TaxID=36100 RepID=UPI001EE62A8F|nr:zinc finger protein 608-like [Haliotis rubra]XP_046583821.1 zinc finger protein 608-like [Haliotis rubra]
MSSVEHTATVDRGLKMKIKRKNVGQSSNKTDQKHEIVKTEKDACKAVSNSEGNTLQTTQNSNGVLEKSTKHCLLSERGDRSPMKMKGSHKGEKKTKEKGKTESGNVLNGGTSCAGPSSVSNGLDALLNQVSMEPRVGDSAQMKREKTVSDPYEFNAKLEDAGPGIELPMKKMKSEKVETASSPMQTSCSDVGVETSNVGVATDPDCLGPCEPGTSITLEGLVWHETENGVLVVNVTWRGKTYVGTLLDATRYDWAPPRFNCESPVSDFETRTPKGRGKRIRGAAGTPVNEKANSEGRKLRTKTRRGSSASFQAPPSPARSDVSIGGVKRKGRPPELDLSDNAKVKRCRSSSRGTPGTESPSPVLIECPEPNCNKKYKHINGLRYHQTHAHHNLGGNQDDDDDDGEDTDAPTPPVTRAGKKGNTSESEKSKEKASSDKDNEENIPLNEIAAASSKAKAAAAAAAAAASTSSSNQEKNTTKSDSNKSDSSKSESTSGSSKKRETAVTSTVTPVTSSAKISVPTTQVYQISGAPIGCLAGVAASVVTQAVTVATTSITASSPSPAPIPVAVTAMTTQPQAAELIKTEASKDKTDKTKTKSATRPIVPAPPPQVIALSSSGTVSHSNLSPVSTQMSPSIRPIQPKPTIMGEPSGINPALVSLRQDRKPRRRETEKKLKKEKDGSNGSALVNNNKQSSKEQVLKDDQSNCKRPAVIKTALGPSRPGETPPRKDNIVPIHETPKTSHESQRPSPSGPSVIATQGLMKGGDQQQAARLNQPPNMLKVNSPLRVTTPDHDRKTPVTEDVQSPAYSDISDANESGSPQQNESPSKKDEVSIKKEKVSTPQGPQGDGSMSSHYGMYSYYGQQYMMPNVAGSHLSPSAPKPHIAGQEGSSGSEDKKQTALQEDRKAGEKKPEDKDDVKVKLEAAGAKHAPTQMHPDYHAKYMQQVYAQIHHLPHHAQYQCLAAYGLIDPNQYHMHMMAQDPHARQQYEKAAADEKRHQQEQGLKDSEGNKQSETRPSSQEHGAQPSEHPGMSKPPQQPQPGQTLGGPQGMQVDRLQDMKKAVSDRPTEREIRDQNLREKQNENHQILKENIELKSQMDRPRHFDMQYDFRNQEEIRRQHMFQQQKMYEQQKRKMELSSEPPELTSTEAGNKKQALGRTEGPKGIEQFRDTKKEVIDGRKNVHGHDMIGKMSTDVKMMDDKSRNSDKHRGPLDVSKTKPSHSVSSSVSTSSPSSNAPSSTAQNASYQSYLQYPSYMQSPVHYGHMGYDPNNPMYRGVNPQVMGYSGTPYLHSPQLGYARVGGPGGREGDKEKLDSSINKSGSAGNPESLESEGKSESVPQGSQFYSNVHKIHELGERGRPSPHGSSPVPQKPGTGESPGTALQVHQGVGEKARDYSNSPPTQRHLHTHHHTHVVSGYGPAMYEPIPYNAPMLMSHSAAATAALQHPYNSK